MILRPFQYVESKTVDDAVAALRNGGEDARVIAGGTALVPLMEHSVLRPSLLVSIAKVPGLADDRCRRCRAVSESVASPPTGRCRIRSPCSSEARCWRTRVRVWRARPFAAWVPWAAISAMASPPPTRRRRSLRSVRPIRLHGPGGERTVPMTEFFTGFYETALRRPRC